MKNRKKVKKRKKCSNLQFLNKKYPPSIYVISLFAQLHDNSCFTMPFHNSFFTIAFPKQTMTSKLVILVYFLSKFSIAKQPTPCPSIVTRAEWGAWPANCSDGVINSGSQYLFIHHTAEPECYTWWFSYNVVKSSKLSF